MARDLRLSIQGDETSGVRALDRTAAAVDRASKELRQAEARTDALAIKARKLAEAEERAADKTRDLATKTAALRKQIKETGDETGQLGRQLDKLARDTKTAALATDDYRRAASRAAGEARDQAQAYDRVADNAREAARATAALAAASAAGGPARGPRPAGVQLDHSLAAAKAEIARLNLSGGPNAVRDLERQFSEIDRIGRLKKRIAKDDEEAHKAGGGFLGLLKGGSSDRLVTGFWKLFGQSVEDVVSSGAGAGTKAGISGASSAANGVLSTPLLGPAVLAGGAAAAIPAASFVGAAVGGGVLAGAGAAGAGLGLAGAWANDPEKYASAWGAATDKIKKRWLDSSAAFGNELDGVLKTADQTLQRLPVEKVLALSQSFVAPLASGAGQGLAGFASGFADALEHVQPVIDKLGPALGNLGNDLGDTLRIISQGSEGGADALSDLVAAIGYTAKATGVLILGFENSYEAIRNFLVGLNTALITLPATGPYFVALEGYLLDIGSTATVTGRKLGQAGDAAHSTASGWGEMGKAAAAATLAAIGLNDSLTELRNTQLASVNANVAVAEGWLNLKDELKDGAKTLDLNTEAGVANEKQIIAQVSALEQQREQTIKLGNETPAAIAAANAAYDAQIAKIKQMAHDAGFSDEKVNELLTSLGAVPTNVQSNLQVNGLPGALGQGIALGNALNNINGRYYYATVDVSYQGYNPGIGLGNLLHHARGGEMPYSGFHVTGEHGPEVTFDSRGAYTATAEQSRKLASMMGSGSATSSGMPARLVIDPGAPAAVAQLVQYLIARGMIQAFVDGKPLSSRRG